MRSARLFWSGLSGIGLGDESVFGFKWCEVLSSPLKNSPRSIDIWDRMAFVYAVNVCGEGGGHSSDEFRQQAGGARVGLKLTG